MSTRMLPPGPNPDGPDQPPVAVLDPLRLLTISADLLPVEVLVSRGTRRVGRYAGFALVIVTALLALWYGLEVVRTTAAEDDRDETLGTVRSLKGQQTGFEELVATQNQSKAINTQLASLMSNDILWSQLTASLVAAAPDEVDLSGISAAVPPAGANTTAVTNLIGPPSVKVIGTLTVNGTGSRQDVIALYVDGLDKVQGLANAFLSSATGREEGFEFSVRVDITSAALENRYKSSAAPSPRAGR